MQKVIVISLLFAYGNCFLTLMDPLSSQASSASKYDHGLVDVLDFLAEEKALRRQLEQVVFDMKQEMSELKQHNTTGLMEEITLLNKSVNNLKVDNQALKQEVTNLKQQDMELLMENANLTERLKYTYDLIANMSGATGKHEVGFTVAFLSNTTVSNGILKFDRISSNFDSSYNQTTGKFTCTKSGLYLFILSIYTTKYGRAVGAIVKNNMDIAWEYTTNNSNGAYYSSSTSAVVHLDDGDQVWVRSPSTVIYGWPSYFSGVLIV